MSIDLRPPPSEVAQTGLATRTARTSVRRVARLVLIVLVIWVVAVGAALVGAQGSSRDARVAVSDARAALRADDLAGAARHLVAAEQAATHAVQLLGGFHLYPLAPLPVAGANLRAARALAEATEAVSRGGGDLLGAAAVELDNSSAGPGGTPLDRIGRLTIPLRTLADDLERSTQAVTDTASPELLGPVAAARDEFLALAAPVLEGVGPAADLAEQLPILLGADTPRRYLVAAASLSELRGSGGLLGSFSVVTASDGELVVEPFAPTGDFEGASAVDVAAPVAGHAERYGPLGGLRHWRNANLSADFPAAAEVLLRLWDAAGHAPLDGVILADTVVFERLVERSGPIEVPGVTTLTAGNTREFVGLEAYETFASQDERKRALGSVATAAFERVADLVAGEELRATTDVLAGLTRDGHLRIYSRDEDVLAALVRARAVGALQEAPGEFAAVVVNNVAANKVDYFTSRRVEHEVELLPGGWTAAVTSVSFRNDAPRDGLPTYVLGEGGDGLRPGDNRSLVTFLCGIGCELTSTAEGVEPGGLDRRHPAADTWLTVPSGEQRSVAVSTRTPDGWRRTSEGVEVTVRHRRQPTVTDDELRITLQVPPGARPVDLPDGATLVDDRLVWEQTDTRSDVELRFRIEGWRP